MQLHYPKELPIVSYRDSFLELFQEHQVIIISGETGSGKTTQLPKFCLESSLTPHYSSAVPSQDEWQQLQLPPEYLKS